jgi:hypothetical protein
VLVNADRVIKYGGVTIRLLKIGKIAFYINKCGFCPRLSGNAVPLNYGIRKNK